MDSLIGQYWFFLCYCVRGGSAWTYNSFRLRSPLFECIHEYLKESQDESCLEYKLIVTGLLFLWTMIIGAARSGP